MPVIQFYVMGCLILICMGFVSCGQASKKKAVYDPYLVEHGLMKLILIGEQHQDTTEIVLENHMVNPDIDGSLPDLLKEDQKDFLLRMGIFLDTFQQDTLKKLYFNMAHNFVDSASFRSHMATVYMDLDYINDTSRSTTLDHFHLSLHDMVGQPESETLVEYDLELKEQPAPRILIDRIHLPEPYQPFANQEVDFEIAAPIEDQHFYNQQEENHSYRFDTLKIHCRYSRRVVDLSEKP